HGLPAGPLPTPTRTGYIFKGWYTTPTNGTQITTTTTINNDTTLHAQWAAAATSGGSILDQIRALLGL
ncbi:MAG: InlB B-repeat-containing protein, partial [Bifidobacteriaceae bacterium]|nr:InlB B-repeat-containing protein [Bifidobacteriaceae bacterium]